MAGEEAVRSTSRRSESATAPGRRRMILEYASYGEGDARPRLLRASRRAWRSVECVPRVNSISLFQSYLLSRLRHFSVKMYVTILLVDANRGSDDFV